MALQLQAIHASTKDMRASQAHLRRRELFFSQWLQTQCQSLFLQGTKSPGCLVTRVNFSRL